MEPTLDGGAHLLSSLAAESSFEHHVQGSGGDGGGVGSLHQIKTDEEPENLLLSSGWHHLNPKFDWYNHPISSHSPRCRTSALTKHALKELRASPWVSQESLACCPHATLYIGILVKILGA
jgi:hypothetical protein